MSTVLESGPLRGELIRLLSAPEGSPDWARGMRWELQSCIADRRSDRAYIGSCLGAMLRYRGWRQLRTAQGKPFGSFLQFCLAPPPDGLGLSKRKVAALIV